VARAGGWGHVGEYPAAPPGERTTMEAAQFLHIYFSWGKKLPLFDIGDCSKLLRSSK